MQPPRQAEGMQKNVRSSFFGGAETEDCLSCGNWVFPFRYALVIGALIFISYLAITIAIRDNLEARTTFSDIAFLIIDGLATIALLYGAFKSRHEGRRIYYAWLMLAFYQLSWTIGDAIYAYLELILYEVPWPSISDVFFLIAYPLFLMGVLLLPGIEFTSIERLKMMLDTAIVLTASTLIFWCFIIAPTIEQNAGTDLLTLTLSVAYPVMDLILLFALTELLLRRIHMPGLNPLLFLASGIIVLIIADTLFFRQTVEGTYVAGGIVDVFYPLSYILTGLAGIAQANAVSRGSFRTMQEFQPRYGQLTWPLYLPYLCAAGAFALLVWSKDQSESIGLSFSSISWAVAGIIGMVIARQVLALNENAQLYYKAQQEIVERKQAEHEIKRLNEELEHRVKERTSELEAANKELHIEVAERKQVEFALKDSERRLADIIDFLPDATFVIDREGNVIAWNKAIEAMTGIKAKEILGHGNYEYALPFYGERRAILIDLVLKADLELEKNYTNIRRLEDGTLTGEAYMPNLRGRSVYLMGNAAALYNFRGEIVGALESIRDITERKRAEEDLQRAKEKAESATRAKSEFLANMSHEIRTPMNAVIGLTGLLLETEMTPIQKDYVETIRCSGDSLLAIINDILDFSKIDGGRMLLESQPFDLRSCVEESLDLVAAKAAEKGLELAYFMEGGVPEIIIGDVTRLRQVLVNLLGNAVKFTENGEVVVSADASFAEDGRVEILFAVKDTGIGISRGNIGSLFQSFSQVDSSTTRNYGGTGLGLAISKRLVELMGGKIRAESVPGEGSTFYFTIMAEVPITKEQPHTKDSILKGKRILIVDDNETARKALIKSVLSWGMEATQASNRQEALNILKGGNANVNANASASASAPDVVLLDAVMPDMDEIALAREVKDAARGDVLVILISPFGRNPLLDPSLAGWVTKPIKPLQLRKLLIDLISPSANAAMAEKSTHQPALKAKIRNLRILLAEDNAVNQKVALSMLKRLGYKADVAANGLEVLQALERQPYDVVLMDVQMPEMDGLEATCRIRKRKSAAEQPWIIAMTAYALEGDREECFRVGMNEYISKPIRMGELQEALDRRSEALKERAVIVLT
jgi:PAS domain S-box-containing protein